MPWPVYGICRHGNVTEYTGTTCCWQANLRLIESSRRKPHAGPRLRLTPTGPRRAWWLAVKTEARIPVQTRRSAAAESQTAKKESAGMPSPPNLRIHYFGGTRVYGYPIRHVYVGDSIHAASKPRCGADDRWSGSYCPSRDTRSVQLCFGKLNQSMSMALG